MVPRPPRPSHLVAAAALLLAAPVAAPASHTVPDGTPAAFVVGVSVQGRPIVAQRRSGSAPAHHLAVIGVIHGDEPAGHRITDALLEAPLPEDVALTVIASANPDGEAAGSRGNAHGVDLNRNFPAGWLPEGASEFTVGGYQPGPAPLSEPESAALHRWLEQTRPDLVVWYHQPWDVVVCDAAAPPWCTGLARQLGLGTEVAPRPGSAVTWGREAGVPSVVIELPEAGVDEDAVRRHVDALLGMFDPPPPPTPPPPPADQTEPGRVGGGGDASTTAAGASVPEARGERRRPVDAPVATGGVALQPGSSEPAAPGDPAAVPSGLVATFRNDGEGLLEARVDFGGAGCPAPAPVSLAPGAEIALGCATGAAGPRGWAATLTNPADGAVVAWAAATVTLAGPDPTALAAAAALQQRSHRTPLPGARLRLAR